MQQNRDEDQQPDLKLTRKAAATETPSKKVWMSRPPMAV